ncbi:MAG: cytochrome c3 family protein [Bacteroidales bacterium]
MFGIFTIYLYGCSPTHRYKALSFFFDGVPNPDNETVLPSNGSLEGTDSALIAQNLIREASRPKIQFHSPYQDKKCASCHNQGQIGKLIESLPGLCYKCHEEFNVRYKVLHGPVGGGQCTMCHNPHMSNNENLLTRTNQSICLYCHDSDQVFESEVHKSKKEVNCTECHNPHGGEDKFILR